MASVAARAVMGTKRVAPCPGDAMAAVDSPPALPKEPPTVEQGSWWPSLLSVSPAAESGDVADVESPQADAGAAERADTAGDENSSPGHQVPAEEPSVSLPPPLPSEDDSNNPSTSPVEDHEKLRNVVVEQVTSATPSDAALLSAAALADGGLVEMEADACSICLDVFTVADPAVLTCCHHEYHFQCVLEWAQRKEECPMCWQALQLSDPSCQELLEACARERKERAAALQAQANLLNSTTHRIVFVRNGHPSRTTTHSRQHSGSPWLTRSVAPAPAGGAQGQTQSQVPPRSGSFFGMSARNRGATAWRAGGSHERVGVGAAPDGGQSPVMAAATAHGATDQPGSGPHSWFKRSGVSKARQGDVPRGGTSVLSTTLSAASSSSAGEIPGPDANTSGSSSGALPSPNLQPSSEGSLSPSLAPEPSVGLQMTSTELAVSGVSVGVLAGSSASRQSQGMLIPQRPATGSRLLSSSPSPASLPSPHGSPSSWRSKFSLRPSRHADK